jgi:putative membrane protein
MCLDPHDVVRWWTFDPYALGTIGVSATVYGLGLARVRRSSAARGRDSGISRAEAAAFYGGQLSLLVALVSPIDRLSDLLFSAHMTQHEILLVVAPMLVVLGRPLVAGMWALPRRGRALIARLRRKPRVVAVVRFATAPLFVLLLHGAAVWIWHVPFLFERTLHDEAVHAVQHLSFFGTAAVFWWTIVRGRYGRLGYGLAVLFVFATATHTSILGALFAVGERVVYPTYAERTVGIIDPVDDQRIAGLVMWIPGGTLLVLAALALFVAWLGEARRRVAMAERRRKLLCVEGCAGRSEP